MSNFNFLMNNPNYLGGAKQKPGFGQYGSFSTVPDDVVLHDFGIGRDGNPNNLLRPSGYNINYFPGGKYKLGGEQFDKKGNLKGFSSAPHSYRYTAKSPMGMSTAMANPDLATKQVMQGHMDQLRKMNPNVRFLSHGEAFQEEGRGSPFQASKLGRDMDEAGYRYDVETGNPDHWMPNPMPNPNRDPNAIETRQPNDPRFEYNADTMSPMDRYLNGGGAHIPAGHYATQPQAPTSPANVQASRLGINPTVPNQPQPMGPPQAAAPNYGAPQNLEPIYVGGQLPETQPYEIETSSAGRLGLPDVGATSRVGMQVPSSMVGGNLGLPQSTPTARMGVPPQMLAPNAPAPTLNAIPNQNQAQMAAPQQIQSYAMPQVAPQAMPTPPPPAPKEYYRQGMGTPDGIIDRPDLGKQLYTNDLFGGDLPPWADEAFGNIWGE